MDDTVSDGSSNLNAVVSATRVLVVDSSRAVRAKITKHLRDHFDYRDEADGEAAWEALVIDHNIRAVITGLGLLAEEGGRSELSDSADKTKLDGFGLLTRIRNSRFARIRDLPVIVIASDDEAAQEQANILGASDFVSPDTRGSELRTRLASLIRLASTQQELMFSRDQQVLNPETGLFSSKYIELQAAQAMAHAARHDRQVSVMALGFDHLDELAKAAGVEAPDLLKKLQLNFARLAAGKLREEDSVGYYNHGGTLVVVSPATSEIASRSVANRLREAVEEAAFPVNEGSLKLSVSVGIANSPIDMVASATALLELATQRMRTAMAAGGNRVIGSSNSTTIVTPAPTIALALELLNEGLADSVRPYAASLTVQLLPLLALVQEESGISLPLAALEEKFVGCSTYKD